MNALDKAIRLTDSKPDDFEVKELQSYKGYGISKAWYVDSDGKRITKYPYFYLVDDGDDYVGNEFSSLSQAKSFIDKIRRLK